MVGSCSAKSKMSCSLSCKPVEMLLFFLLLQICSSLCCVDVVGQAREVRVKHGTLTRGGHYEYKGGIEWHDAQPFLAITSLTPQLLQIQSNYCILTIFTIVIMQLVGFPSQEGHVNPIWFKSGEICGPRMGLSAVSLAPNLCLLTLA